VTRTQPDSFAQRRHRRPRRNRPVVRSAARGFTLVELLVTVSIVALMLSLLLPALGSVRRNVKVLLCSSNMRTVTVAFSLFADGSTPDRGDSEKLGPKRFWINDVQESLYGIDEFWDQGDQPGGVVAGGDNPMLCPAGARNLTKKKGAPCGSAALGPAEDVTLAFNMRLYRAEVDFMGTRVLTPAAATNVRAAVLDHPYVPIVIDVDGKKAANLAREPFYIAPPVRGVEGPYSDGRHWMPSTRHGGMTNVAFVGGHVLRSEHPQLERWDWSYQADTGQ